MGPTEVGNDNIKSIKSGTKYFQRRSGAFINRVSHLNFRCFEFKACLATNGIILNPNLKMMVIERIRVSCFWLWIILSYIHHISINLDWVYIYDHLAALSG